MTRYTEGFSHFVTTMTAPVASGWSDGCRVGFTPTEERRLCTAHTHSQETRHPKQYVQWDSVELDAIPPDQLRQFIVTAQGRNRVRMLIVLPLSAIGRSHPGNPGQMGNPVEIHAEGVLQCHLEAFLGG